MDFDIERQMIPGNDNNSAQPDSVKPSSRSRDGCSNGRESPGVRSSARRSPSPGSNAGENEPIELQGIQSRPSPSLSSRDTPRRRSTSSNVDFRHKRSTSTNSQDSKNSRQDEEAIWIINFADELRREEPPGEPWFMEMTRLRRLHFLWLNKKLAASRKKLLEDRRASNDDLKAPQILLHDQAEAIRDFQYIQSLEILSTGRMEQRKEMSEFYFPNTAKSVEPGVYAFETENYRCLPRAQQTALQPFSDEIRELMRTYLPSKIRWTKAEVAVSPDFYREGKAPKTLSPSVDRLARFTIAMAGALFILVLMYIMAIDQSRTKNLVTTTVAVLLFALLCSVTLRTSNDQMLGATAGYAAVLMVFVGLTSSQPESR